MPQVSHHSCRLFRSFCTSNWSSLLVTELYNTQEQVILPCLKFEIKSYPKCGLVNLKSAPFCTKKELVSVNS